MVHLISVIVPVYNVEKYLPRCIDSIILQTYKDLEIILIDDGSTDNSGKICDEYATKDKRIKVVHKQNGGVSSARNKGLEFATGQYISFIDGDDFIDEDMFEYLFNLITFSKASIARCEVYGEKKSEVKTGIYNSLEGFNNCFPYIYLWNMLFTRNVISELKFDENISLAEDMKFCFEAFLKSEKIVCGDKEKYHYCVNSQGLTRKTFNVKKLTYFEVLDFVADRIKNNNLKKKIEIQKAYHAVGFLRQITDSDFKDEQTICYLIETIKGQLFSYLFARYKLSNKLFALTCCINFNLAKKIYLFLQGKR